MVHKIDLDDEAVCWRCKPAVASLQHTSKKTFIFSLAQIIPDPRSSVQF